MIDETNLHTVPGGDERVLYDDAGNTYYKDDKKGIIPWAELVESNRENSVRSLLDLNLEDVGKIVYVRVTETGYQRIIGSERSGKAVSGQSWEDLSPGLSKRRAADLAGGGSLVPTENLEVQEPEAIEIGWYQDPDGNLYQYDGDKWVDGNVSVELKKQLEYLG
jgi:hypothetical protein